MPNYLDNVDLIDANGIMTNIQLQDRGTLALAQQVANDLQSEIAARTTADSALTADLQSEISARTTADSALTADLQSEISARTTADSALTADLQSEISNRQNADNTLTTLINRTTMVVNVKAFGAVGDAKYYDKATRSYWADSSFTIAPTNDVIAVNAAIQYAEDNNIDAIYFPSGYYYLPNWNYVLDISKHSLIGDGDSALVSNGLTSGNFITIRSPLTLDMYNTSKTPINGLSIWGSYGLGSGVEVNGIYIDDDVNAVACHSSFENIVVKDFYAGLKSNQGYKTLFYNFNVIACQVGIWLMTGSAIPQYFVNGFVECCGIGLRNSGTGWSQAVFVNYAFEYNLQHIAVANGNHFISCRFESDPLCVSSSYMFTINGDYNYFENCDFLLLGNYVLNVQWWVNNPSQYLSSSLSYAIMAGNGSVHINNCRFGLDDISIDSGFYLIGLPVYVVNSYFNLAASQQSRLIDSANYKTIENEFILS